MPRNWLNLKIWFHDRHAKCFCQYTSAAIVSLVVEVVIKVAYHVAYGLFSSFWIQSILYRFSCFDQVVNIDARTVTKDTPKYAR
jgi:hypothetical protein